MKITLLCTGKTNDKHVIELVSVYKSRLKNYCNFSIVETPDVKSAGPVELKKKETALLKKEALKADHVILLDEKGHSFTSVQFSGFIEKKQIESKKHLIFIVGGAYGFSEEIYAMAHDKISLSKMTFPHQLVRLFFVEQLYRAFTILHHEPYHH